MGSDGILQRRFTRRSFLKTTTVTAGAAMLTLGATQCDPALIRRLQQAKNAIGPRHSAWIWQFSTDGAPESIAERLSDHGLSALVKTHDGIEWMSKYDHSAPAISGPRQVEHIARIFENAGVPFHAWSVIKGGDPVLEAQMAFDVLNAGARSLVLDLEGSAGFWVGTQEDALRFGDELRRLTPFGRVDISIDPRPWRINLVPMAEFVATTDGIWPQLYWDTFNTQANLDGYRNSGYPAGADGMSPEFLLDTTSQVLGPYGREIIPVGQGSSANTDMWARFAVRAWALGWGSVSTWRLGVTPAATLQYLEDNPAGIAPKPPNTPTPGASATRTRTPTRTPSPTRTASPTRTTSPTRTVTTTPSVTPTPLAETATATPSIEATLTATATP